ncbi:MAG: hypothetical protein IJZ26_00725 [Clostridia bacterium]|nr:hypothetical protein [Clostridia bacterium]
MAVKNKSPLDIIVCFVPHDKTEHTIEILTNMGVYFQIATIANGKEKSGLLDYLGMLETDLSMIAGFIESSKAHNAIYNLCRNMELYKANKGMAFSIPVVAISRNDLNKILKYEPPKKEKKEDDS